MALNGIPINENECIGDSLDTINNAFIELDGRITSTNTNITVLSAASRQFAYDTTNTFYVNGAGTAQSWRGTVNVSAGNDLTANGSPTKPFSTLKGCLEYIYNKIDCNGGNPSIRLCSGSYAGAWISGMPVGTSKVTTNEAGTGETPTNRQFEILGNSSTTTFITQVKNQDASPATQDRHFWSHLRIDNGVYLFLEGVGFRYNSSNPITPTTSAGGTGPVTIYNALKVSDNCVVTVKNCLYESILMVLTNSDPQQSYTIYNSFDGYCRVNFDNITINNTDSRTTSNARYFLLSVRSAVYFYNSIVLQNNPRFNIFTEPVRASHLVFSGVTWTGNFGSQAAIPQGTVDAFDAAFNYRPDGAKNYIIKADGPHCWGSGITEPSPGTNSFLNAYSAATNASYFNFGFPQGA